MKNNLLLTFFVFFSTILFSQKTYTISGYITDENGEELIGATVFISDLQIGGVTNEYGFYSITITEGEHELIYSYIGFQNHNETINLTENLKKNISLVSTSEEIDEVTITAKRKDENVKAVQMSSVKLQSKEIKKIPALLGETDVIKALQLMPGIQAVGEGFSGFNVRGGSADQNLILLDEATVYNSSHLMGFFSIFNNDVIKEIQLYKGDIPAKYGGRLSSLLEVHMKEGNSKKLSGSGGIGTISSRLTIEAPIIKDKWSFVMSGRRSYADLFLLLSSDEEVRNNQLYFYDLNLKTNYKINAKNRIFVSGYFGRDVFEYSDLFGFDWGNATGTIRWNHLFSEKLFSNFSFISSFYDYKMGDDSSTSGFLWTSDLNDYKVKADFTYFMNPRNKIKYGADVTFHYFNPGYARGTGDSTIYIDVQVPTSNALEYAAYISNEHQLTDKLTINYGLRGTIFQNMGESTVYNFDENYNTTDSTVYDQWEIYNTFYGLEPRLSLRYLTGKNSSIKASYSRTKQYLHLASNSTAGSPLDVWVPASPNIAPQIANQVSVGYFQNLFDNILETSVEVYYKKMQNQIDFADHAEILLNPELEGEMRIGEAWSYGAEFLIRKQVGKLTGWISYTLSKTERQIPEINDGDPYPASYDKPHDIAIVGSYDFNERINFSATWVYSTGSAVTFPTGRFEYNNMIVPIYSDRNSYRMPDYHRLDVSLTIKGRSTKKKTEEPKKVRSELNISIYNLYNRKNAWMITFTQDSDNPNTTQAEKVYLFPMIPSITYNFYF